MTKSNFERPTPNELSSHTTRVLPTDNIGHMYLYDVAPPVLQCATTSRITFSIDGDYNHRAVEGDNVNDAMREFFHRHRWKKAHDYLALPNVRPSGRPNQGVITMVRVHIQKLQQLTSGNTREVQTLDRHCAHHVRNSSPRRKAPSPASPTLATLATSPSPPLPTDIPADFEDDDPIDEDEDEPEDDDEEAA